MSTPAQAHAQARYVSYTIAPDASLLVKRFRLSVTPPEWRHGPRRDLPAALSGARHRQPDQAAINTLLNGKTTITPATPQPESQP